MMKAHFLTRVLCLLFLMLPSSCAVKENYVTKTADNLKTLYLQVSKYEKCTINTYWTLGLHPKDVVLDVSLVSRDFGFSKSIGFSYNKDDHLLSTEFVLDAPYTVFTGSLVMELKITYLEYYELRRDAGKRDVFYLAHLVRKLNISSEYSDHVPALEVPYEYNKWHLEKWRYNQLYQELASLGGSKREKLRKAITEDLVDAINSDDLKAYLQTARLILNRL